MSNHYKPTTYDNKLRKVILGSGCNDASYDRYRELSMVNDSKDNINHLLHPNHGGTGFYSRDRRRHGR